MPHLFRSSGQEVAIGETIGSGGEGSVFAVKNSTSIVAKVYRRPTDHAKQQKLIAMVQANSPTLASISCWPLDTLHSAPGKDIVGFLMPRLVDHQAIHKLYSPAHRKLDFPKADWSFLIHSARNLAAAVETIHAAGHVVGDINQGNAYVSKESTVKLIDCDSIQVQLNGTAYLCEVGVAHFTPPELQNKNFHGLRRTPNNDNFGLAVLCFHLLFMGRHPFAGRYLGSGEMPIEKAIHESRFAFGTKAASNQMEPPPNTFPLEYASRPIANLFEKAFARESGHKDARPTAMEWRQCLDQIKRELVTCHHQPIHKYHSSLSSCMWCGIEKYSQIFFFVIPFDSNWTTGPFDLAALWNQVEAIVPPGLAQVPQVAGTITPNPVLLALRIKQTLITIFRVLGIVVGLVIIFGFKSLVGAPFILLAIYLFNKDPLEYERRQRTEAKQKASEEWDAMYSQWKSECGDQPFISKKNDLEQRRRTYMGLNDAYRKDLQSLERDRRASQLRAFSKGYFIDSASIPGFGQGRKSLLTSYGIETAADISMKNLNRVPGIGVKRARDLMLWKGKIEAKFAFNPNQGVSQSEVASIKHDYTNKRLRLEKELKAGVSELQQSSQAIIKKRMLFQKQMHDCAVRHAQALADLAAL